MRSNLYGERWALFRWFEIPDASQPDRVYLRRLRIVQTPWFGVYLHWIYLPDADRDLHDHPWNFISIVLRGGYVEELRRNHATSTTEVNFWNDQLLHCMHRMPTYSAHRIRSVEPGTLTLVLVGRRRRGWGFWTDAGFVPWEKYVAEQGRLGPDPFMEAAGP